MNKELLERAEDLVITIALIVGIFLIVTHWK
jgi:hypothetical protein